MVLKLLQGKDNLIAFYGPYLHAQMPLKVEKNEIVYHMFIRVDRSEENFPKSILTMVFGCQNASG